MKEYYHRRGIKAEFDQRWRVVLGDWEAASEAERVEKGLREPHEVSMRAEFTRSYMEAESAQFLEELENENEAQYQERLGEWQKGRKLSTTPQEYHQ